jgi:hypothetical protein
MTSFISMYFTARYPSTIASALQPAQSGRGSQLVAPASDTMKTAMTTDERLIANGSVACVDRHAMDYPAIVELRSYFPFVDPNIRKDHGCNLDRIVFV